MSRVENDSRGCFSTERDDNTRYSFGEFDS